MAFVRNFRRLALEDASGMATIHILVYPKTYRDLHQIAVIIAGCFASIALVLSILLIFQHLRSYTNPAEQKWIVAVLLMVPIYASESCTSIKCAMTTHSISSIFCCLSGRHIQTEMHLMRQILSLWKPNLSLACDILRNCYEAFALYAFGSYLIACLGGERSVIELLEDESRKLLSKPLLEGAEEKPESQQRKFCNFILQPRALGKDLLKIEIFGLVQYMILKTVCALLALVLELFGVYGDGEFKLYYGYPYMAVVLNFSQMWALYCLVQFYNVTHERLKPIKPLAKFISFKAIVFATWWQGVGIALLCDLGVLPNDRKIKNGLQDFLICIEMAIAAVAHVFVFSAKPYQFVPASEHGKVATQTTKETLKLEEGGKEKQAVVERIETEVEAPGTSVKESIQDIVVEGGQHVVKDVVLTINQAFEPVEKGMTKIQETFHQITVASDGKEEDPEHEVEEHVELEHSITGSGSQVLSAEEKLITDSTGPNNS